MVKIYSIYCLPTPSYTQSTVVSHGAVRSAARSYAAMRMVAGSAPSSS